MANIANGYIEIYDAPKEKYQKIKEFFTTHHAFNYGDEANVNEFDAEDFIAVSFTSRWSCVEAWLAIKENYEELFKGATMDGHGGDVGPGYINYLEKVSFDDDGDFDSEKDFADGEELYNMLNDISDLEFVFSAEEDDKDENNLSPDFSLRVSN